MRKSETTRQLLMASSVAAMLVGAIVLPTVPASAVLMVTPNIVTTEQPASVTVGGSIADMATVTGGNNPTGTVTFELFNNPTGSGVPILTNTVPLVGGSATSTGYTTSATGTYSWVAIYSGDSNNNGVTSGAACEPVTILPAPPASPAQTAASVAGCSTVPAPEPASFALLVAGLGFLGFVRRRSG
jgi:hypothetical protein